MKKMVIIRNGSCRRCGQCCDKSKAQPMMWAIAEETEDPEYRMFSTNKGKRRQPRVCDRLGWEKTIAIPDYSENDEFGNPSLEMVDRPAKARCAIYKTRPSVCRDFPTHPKDLMEIDNCGYYFTIEWRDVE